MIQDGLGSGRAGSAECLRQEPYAVVPDAWICGGAVNCNSYRNCSYMSLPELSEFNVRGRGG